MNTKLILVEGIPGSGKTTYARKIAEWFKSRGVPTNLFLEGQPHPADLGWSACVPVANYRELLQRYSSLQAEIEKQTTFENDNAIVAYTQVKTENKEFYSELEAFEVYNARVPDDMFTRLHYDRWSSFGKSAEQRDELNIFECAFLQNHVNELLFWRQANEHTTIQHLNRLIDCVKQLSPVLIYLSQPNIRETIERIANERASAEYGNWIDLCIAYCESTPYGKSHNIKGFDDAIEIFTIRKQLEMRVISQLTIPHIIIENEDYDWDDVWNKIESYLTNVEKYPA